MKGIGPLLQIRNWKRMAAVGAAAAAIAAVMIGCGKEPEVIETTTVAETTEVIVQEELSVSEEEAELLSKLYQAMDLGDYNEAATVLNENEEAFSTMMQGSLNGEKYSYSETTVEGITISEMEPVTAASEFEGLVLTRYNTAFFGTFSEGRPNGTCFAIQTMILDHPRYSYAEGVWKDGKLNGEGRAGYYYYQEAPESGFVRTEKRGTYLNNLLDGMFVYETESGSGEILSWEMKAIGGVTVITPEWEHYPLRKEYMLGSLEDPARAYVLAENKVAAVLWNNLIVWDE